MNVSLDFYEYGYTETESIIDDDLKDMFNSFTRIVPYRFASPFADWRAIKKEVMDFVKMDAPYEFDMVYLYGDDIEGLTMWPTDIGYVIEQLFIGENVKFIVVIRRLSYFWFRVEVYEDRLNKIAEEIKLHMLTQDPTELTYYDLYEVLNKRCPVRSWKFMKDK